jgi:prevent-host-death family protein
MAPMRTQLFAQDVISISDLRSDTAKWIKRCQGTGSPLVVTQHGRAALVLLSPRAFDDLSESARVVSAVEEGPADIDEGRVVVSHGKIMKEMPTKSAVAAKSSSKTGRKTKR